MNIVMFGPPGAGKGSVSAALVSKLNLPHISTGDIIRAESKKPDNKLKPYMEKGELVPDQLVMELVEQRLKEDDCKAGFILDGFPRTIPQAEFLESHGIHIDHVLNFSVAEEELIKRLSGRRMDPETGTIYNIHTLEIPDGVDVDKLIQRPDDKEDVIKNRIDVYKKDTEPVLSYYREKGSIREVDANPLLDQVIENALSFL